MPEFQEVRMSDATESNTPVDSAAHHGDALAASVVILLSINVIQRSIGFVRSVFFCRLLSPAELGRWDLVFNFIILAAPFVSLAIPAAFGRYAEYFRSRGQLRTMIRRTAQVGLVLALVGSIALYLFRQSFSSLIFGLATETRLTALIAICLFVTILTHYVIELLNGLRRAKVLAMVHLSTSVIFAVAGVGLLYAWKDTAESVVLGNTIACALTLAWVFFYLRPSYRGLSRPDEEPSLGEFWKKIMPFVGWITLTNLMANLFIVCDRYMIVHYATVGPEEKLGLVGQYHSSRVVPLLLVSICFLLGNILLPHLSDDWEQGRRKRVHERMNLFVKLCAIGLTGAGLAVLICKPLIFDWAFKGKYSDGLAVLPLTLTYCVWFGLTAILQNYLFCVEKARLTSWAFMAGLISNVGLNYLLLPRYGLAGAVTATTIANLLVLILIAWFNRVAGFRYDGASLAALALPGLLILGIIPSLLGFSLICVFSLWTHAVFPESQKELFRAKAAELASKAGFRRGE